MNLCTLCDLWGKQSKASWMGFWEDGKPLKACVNCKNSGFGVSMKRIPLVAEQTA